MWNKLKIARMELDHLPQVIAIEQNSFSTPWTVSSFTSEVSENVFASYIVCLGEGQEVVGYAGMWQIVDEIHITTIAVKDKYRGNRIAEGMLRHLMLLGKLNKAERVTLEVRPSNQAAQRVYERLGFKEAGRRPKYYQDNGEDAIIMWKNMEEVQGQC